VIAEKCDGCKGQDKTACMYICPNDLMVLDKERMKAYNRDPQIAGSACAVSRFARSRPWTSAVTPTSCPWVEAPLR